MMKTILNTNKYDIITEKEHKKMLSTRELIKKRIKDTMDELLKANTFGRLESFIMNEGNEITYVRELLGYWKGCNIYIATGDVNICINTVDMRIEGYYNNEYQAEEIKDFDILNRIDNIVKLHME